MLIMLIWKYPINLCYCIWLVLLSDNVDLGADVKCANFFFCFVLQGVSTIFLIFVLPEVILHLPIITALECFVSCFDSYSYKMHRKLFVKNKSPLRGRQDPCRMHPSLSDGERLACNESLHSKHVPSVFWASHMIPTCALGHGKQLP